MKDKTIIKHSVTLQEVTSRLLTVLTGFRSDSNILGICDIQGGTEPGVSPNNTNFTFPLRSCQCAIFIQLSSGVREVGSFGCSAKGFSLPTQRIITKAMLPLLRHQHKDTLLKKLKIKNISCLTRDKSFAMHSY
jgi:hypothetical protein